MVDRPRSALARGRAPACATLALIVATVAACGSQIPFGTPRTSGGTTATAGPGGSGGSPVASATTPPASNGPASDAPFPTPATTEVTYSVANAGIRITLPAGWVGYDARTSEAATLAAAREHPELAASFDALRSEQLLFVALDASSSGAGGPPSLTIAGIGGAIASPQLLESLARSIAGQITSTQDVAGEVDLEPVELPSGATVNLRWRLEPAGAEPLSLDAYVLSVGERAVLATFAAPTSGIEDVRPTFQAIAGSLAPA